MNYKRIFIICAIAAGAAWGGLRLLFLSPDVFNELSTNLRFFVGNFYYFQIDSGGILLSLFRHSYLFCAILFFRFIPRFSWAVYPLLYLRVMTVSFAVSIMILTFGASGILISLVFNIPQNIFAIGACVYIFYKIDAQSLLKTFCIGAGGILCAALYEIFAAPFFLTLLI